MLDQQAKDPEHRFVKVASSASSKFCSYDSSLDDMLTSIRKLDPMLSLQDENCTKYENGAIRYL